MLFAMIVCFIIRIFEESYDDTDSDQTGLSRPKVFTIQSMRKMKLKLVSSRALNEVGLPQLMSYYTDPKPMVPAEKPEKENKPFWVSKSRPHW